MQAHLDRLASGNPEPGGGFATALAVAIGAALVSMVCRLTAGGPVGQEHREAIAATLDAAEQLRVEALALAEADATAYAAVTEARNLPRGTEQERAVRTARTQEALRAATQIPLRIAAAAAQVTTLCARIADLVNRSARSDLRVGGLLARAALEGAALTVRANLALIHDEAFTAAAETEVQRFFENVHGASRFHP